jgi:putative tryptophan/tyrosine transport system substrate-binding protein
VKRRDFITLIGGAAAWPLAARAQQTGVPVIGLLSSLESTDSNIVKSAFHEGLSGLGFVEGRNVAIEYRWAEGDYRRLPALAVELVQRKIAVIAAIGGTPAALAAKAATTTIPIVFAIGGDPIGPGLVPSLSRPGGNITGVTFYGTALVTKRLDLARELISKERTIAMLVHPDNPPSVRGRESRAGGSSSSRARPMCAAAAAAPAAAAPTVAAAPGVGDGRAALLRGL